MRTPLVVIGASAGGPAAVGEILSALPGDFPAAVIVVQHMDEAFTPGLIAWLAGHAKLPVRVAVHGDVPRVGEVLVANGRDHLVLTASGRVQYQVEPRQAPYRPAIDLLFQTVARHARGFVAGVLLTGMGRDGASGLQTLRLAGALTIVQDRETSAIYGMPKAAIALDMHHIVLPLGEIANRIAAAVASPAVSLRSARRG